MNSPNKIEQVVIKRNHVNRAIEAVLHLLHESFMYGTTIWPKKGFLVGWYPEKMDSITIGAKVTDGHGIVILNLHGPNYTRLTKQCKAIELILNDAFYEGVHLKYVRGGSHHVFGPRTRYCSYSTTTDQLIYEFTIDKQ